MVSSVVQIVWLVCLACISIISASSVAPVSPMVQLDENSGVTINMFYVEGEGSLSLELKIKNKEEQYYIIVSTEDGSVQLCDKLFSVANGDNVQCAYDKNILKHGDNQFLITIFSVDRKKIVLRTSAHFYYEGYVINGVEVQPNDLLEVLADNKEVIASSVLGGAAVYAGYKYMRSLQSTRSPLPTVSDISDRLDKQLPVVPFSEPPPSPPSPPPAPYCPPPYTPAVFSAPAPLLPPPVVTKQATQQGLQIPLAVKVSGVALGVTLGYLAARSRRPLRSRSVVLSAERRGGSEGGRAFTILTSQAAKKSDGSDALSKLFQNFPMNLVDRKSTKVKFLFRAMDAVDRLSNKLFDDE